MGIGCWCFRLVVLKHSPGKTNLKAIVGRGSVDVINEFEGLLPKDAEQQTAQHLRRRALQYTAATVLADIRPVWLSFDTIN